MSLLVISVCCQAFAPAKADAEEALGATMERFEGQVPGVGFVWAWRVAAIDGSSVLADAGVEVGDFVQSVQLKADRDAASAVTHESFDGMMSLLQTAPDESFLTLDVVKPRVGVSKVSLEVGLAPGLAGLETLHLSGEHVFQRIYRGQKPDHGDSPYRRLMRHANFHAAYWKTCGQASDEQMWFHRTSAVAGGTLIGVREEDYARYVVATDIYPDVSRQIYNNANSNDYSVREVGAIYAEAFLKEIGDWQSLLSRYGCTGEVHDRFRENLRNELTQLEFSDGSRQVEVGLGGMSYSVSLPRPLDMNRSKLIGAAEVASQEDQIFNTSYSGQILRAITIGNFEQVAVINSAFFDEVFDVTGAVGDLFGIDRNDPVVLAMRQGLELSNTLTKDSGILTAYVLGRVYHLGGCGDQMTSFTQENTSWTEYRNGFGQHISSSPEIRRTSRAELPTKFSSIIRAQNSIETSRRLEQEMAAIIGKLTCDSPARMQLEDNIIAYFAGAAPRHIAPVPER